MQWILIIAAIVFLVAFQQFMIIYILPALAIGYFYFWASIKLFVLKIGSPGMILNFLIAVFLCGGFLVFVVTNSPSWKKWTSINVLGVILVA